MLLSPIEVLKTFGLNYVLNITLELKRVSIGQIKIALNFFLKNGANYKKKWEVLHNTDFPVASNF